MLRVPANLLVTYHGLTLYVFVLLHLKFKVVPEGFKDLLIWIASEYNNPEIIITENGFSDAGELVDDGRVSYYRVRGFVQLKYFSNK